MKPTLLVLLAALTLTGGAAVAAPTFFESVNNDSDITGVAHDTDPLLVDPWGVTTGPEGNLHVSDEGSGVSTLYGPAGSLLITSGTHSITIAPASVSGTIGTPTGVDVNEKAILDSTLANDFTISASGTSGPSKYLYCTEDGAIEGFNEKVDPNSAVIGATATPPAGYTGMALSWVSISGTLNHQLYAANFAQGKVDVYDTSFGLLASGAEFSATPPAVPASAPTGAAWSPFNIHRVDFKHGKAGTERRLLVTYALHLANSLTCITGAGYGYADLYDTNGNLDRRLVGAGGLLDAPWGVAVAHDGLGKLKAPIVIFIGNHGDGEINAYSFDPTFPLLTGVHLGTLKNDQGNPLAFDGLWTLHFGTKKITLAEFLADPADLTEDKKDLYFSAGLLDGTHGLVGRIFIP